MRRNFAPLLFLCAIFLIAPQPSQAVTIDTVPIGNVGNANDPLTGNVYGGVDYAYRIGTTEVTNAQYVDFLNAKAAHDPLALYDLKMGSDPHGGITRSGVIFDYVYATKPDMADKPVNFVSWYDSLRFANWLNNGQGSGDTETGAYTLGVLGSGGIPLNGASITRNPGATWFLTGESEWYKAAYYQPAAEGGDVDNYWLYPTANNTTPTVATANSLGDINNPGPNVANYNFGADWNGQNGNVTTVGSAGPLSQSFYGTSDQGGNVYEWTEALIADPHYPGGARGARGGGYSNNSWAFLASTQRSYGGPDNANPFLGFRVALVPEPSSFVLAALGLATLVAWIWKRTRAQSAIARA